VLEFFLLFIEDGHGQIVTGDVGIILGVGNSALSSWPLAVSLNEPASQANGACSETRRNLRIVLAKN
jgi:hypothetical protein